MLHADKKFKFNLNIIKFSLSIENYNLRIEEYFKFLP